MNKSRVFSVLSAFIIFILLPNALQATCIPSQNHLVYKICQKKKKPVPPPTGEGKVMEDPDIPPLYTGGPAAMRRFISTTLRYPSQAVENNIQGLVVHTFVVEKDGTLSNFTCIHHADSLLDAEALRILKEMPPWRPGKLNGEVVRTKSYVPMYFRLNKNSQSTTASKKTVSPPEKKVIHPDSVVQTETIFTIVDEMPHYPGGDAALAKFLSSNISYPSQAFPNGVEGRILASFIVSKEGNISNIQIIEGNNAALNDEAVRVLSIMPAWVAGINNGEKVNVKCILPIDFTVNGKSTLSENDTY